MVKIHKPHTLLTILFIIVLLLAAIPSQTHGQTRVNGTLNGTTSQGERITIVFEHGKIILLEVGVHIPGLWCSSFYTAVHRGLLGQVVDNRFEIVIEKDQESLHVTGELGARPKGTLDFKSKPALKDVCQGSISASWGSWESLEIPTASADTSFVWWLPTPTPKPGLVFFPDQPVFQRYTIVHVIDAFRSAGLFIDCPYPLDDDDYQMASQLAVEGTSCILATPMEHTTISLFSFAAATNMEHAKQYYQSLNRCRGAQCNIYTQANILMVIRGHVSEEQAQCYETILTYVNSNQAGAALSRWCH